MGLDMMLNAKRYLMYNETETAEKLTEPFPELKEKGRKVKEVIVEAVYWRKVNAVHKWFVDNVQEGVDDCGYYYVDSSQLEELVAIAKRSLETRDPTILPPQSGFFFGSTEIDEWYWDGLEHTVEAVTRALEDFPGPYWDFEYHSSW